LVASRRAAEVALGLIIVRATSRWHDNAMAEVQRLADSWFGVAGTSPRDSPDLNFGASALRLLVCTADRRAACEAACPLPVGASLHAHWVADLRVRSSA
jgi:hypothetical protein